MIIKFMMLWAFIASGVGAWLYYFKANDKRDIKSFLKGTTISSIISAIIIAILMFVNNLGGI